MPLRLPSLLRSVFLLLSLGLLLGCSAEQPPPPLTKDTVILAFGDSLTFGTGVEASQSYPSVLAELSGATVISAGVPGEVTAAGLRRLPGLLEMHQPDILVLCHGGNDILRRKSRFDARNNLIDMVRLAQNQGVHVVMLAVPQFGLVPTAAPWYQEVAEATGVALDTQTIPSLQRDSGYKSDTVHFNEAGYRKMAEAVLDLLRS